MAATVFDVLKGQIGEQRSSAVDFLACGGPKDYPQYMETVGLIRGLDASINYIEDLSRKYMDDDDD